MNKLKNGGESVDVIIIVTQWLGCFVIKVIDFLLRETSIDRSYVLGNEVYREHDGTRMKILERFRMEN